LKEELPGRYRRADDGDDQQHHLVQCRSFRHLRYQHILDHLAHRRVDVKQHRKHEKTAKNEAERETLEAAKASRACRKQDDGSSR
jgi:hypothetical protein